MDESAGVVCEVDSPLARGLAQALEGLRRGEGIGAVVAWVTTYRADELRSGELIAERLQRFKKVGDAFASFLLSYRISMTYRAAGAADGYLRDLETALSKIIAIDGGMAEDAEELRALLRSGEFDELSERLAGLASAGEDEEAGRYLRGYERKLRDNTFLVEELNRIFAFEYNSRAERIRAGVAGRAQTMGGRADRLRRQVAEVDAAIDELSRDENLTTEDRAVLLRSFLPRRSELAKRLKAAEGRALVVGALLAEYRSVTARLSSLLSRLQGRLDRLAARNGYIRRLYSAGSEAPAFEAVLEEASGMLISNGDMLEESLMLLDEACRDELLAAIDSDRVLGSVTVRLKGAPNVTFSLVPCPATVAAPLSVDTNGFAVLEARAEANRTRAATHSRRSVRPVVRPASGADNVPS